MIQNVDIFNVPLSPAGKKQSHCTYFHLIWTWVAANRMMPCGTTPTVGNGGFYTSPSTPRKKIKKELEFVCTCTCTRENIVFVISSWLLSMFILRMFNLWHQFKRCAWVGMVFSLFRFFSLFFLFFFGYEVTSRGKSSVVNVPIIWCLLPTTYRILEWFQVTICERETPLVYDEY